MSDVVKTCGCGISYDAEGWGRLNCAGYQLAEDDDPEGPVAPRYYPIEARDCRCGATIAVEIDEADLASLVLAFAAEMMGTKNTSSRVFGSAIDTAVGLLASRTERLHHLEPIASSKSPLGRRVPHADAD